MDVDDPPPVVGGDLHQREEAAEDDEVGLALADRVEDRGAELGASIWAVRLARASGMPAASARAIAPIRGLLATTWTICAFSRRARIRSIRFWSVVPPPETQTASRIGGSVIGGLRRKSAHGGKTPRSRLE